MNETDTLITLRKLESAARGYRYRDGSAQFSWATEPEPKGNTRAVMTIRRNGRVYRVTV